MYGGGTGGDRGGEFGVGLCVSVWPPGRSSRGPDVLPYLPYPAPDTPDPSLWGEERGGEEIRGTCRVSEYDVRTPRKGGQRLSVSETSPGSSLSLTHVSVDSEGDTKRLSVYTL